MKLKIPCYWPTGNSRYDHPLDRNWTVGAPRRSLGQYIALPSVLPQRNGSQTIEDVVYSDRSRSDSDEEPGSTTSIRSSLQSEGDVIQTSSRTRYEVNNQNHDLDASYLADLYTLDNLENYIFDDNSVTIRSNSYKPRNNCQSRSQDPLDANGFPQFTRLDFRGRLEPIVDLDVHIMAAQEVEGMQTVAMPLALNTKEDSYTNLFCE